jgi:hypothetical protein
MASGKVCFTKVVNSVASNSVSIDLFGKI